MNAFVLASIDRTASQSGCGWSQQMDRLVIQLDFVCSHWIESPAYTHAHTHTTHTHTPYTYTHTHHTHAHTIHIHTHTHHTHTTHTHTPPAHTHTHTTPVSHSYLTFTNCGSTDCSQNRIH